MTSRLLIALAAAGALASAVAFAPWAVAQQQPDATQPATDEAAQGPMQHRVTPEDKEAFLDARLAAVHAGLRLSADQEKLWPVVEGAVRDAVTQMRDERQKMKEAADEADKKDPIAHMRRMAERTGMISQSLTKVADAAQPLYASLSDDQKWRLHALLRAIHMHGPGMMGMMGMEPGMGMAPGMSMAPGMQGNWRGDGGWRHERDWRRDEDEDKDAPDKN